MINPINFKGSVFFANNLNNSVNLLQETALHSVANNNDCDIFVYQKSNNENYKTVIAKDGKIYKHTFSQLDLHKVFKGIVDQAIAEDNNKPFEPQLYAIDCFKKEI